MIFIISSLRCPLPISTQVGLHLLTTFATTLRIIDIGIATTSFLSLILQLRTVLQQFNSSSTQKCCWVYKQKLYSQALRSGDHACRVTSPKRAIIGIPGAGSRKAFIDRFPFSIIILLFNSPR